MNAHIFRLLCSSLTEVHDIKYESHVLEDGTLAIRLEVYGLCGGTAPVEDDDQDEKPINEPTFLDE